MDTSSLKQVLGVSPGAVAKNEFGLLKSGVANFGMGGRLLSTPLPTSLMVAISALMMELISVLSRRCTYSTSYWSTLQEVLKTQCRSI